MGMVFMFGKPSANRKKRFIQEANRRSRLKGTRGTFGKYCKSQGLAPNGKVTLACIRRAKRSGNTKLIRRAVFAQNIKAYEGARKKTKVRRLRRRTTRFGEGVENIPKIEKKLDLLEQKVEKVPENNRKIHDLKQRTRRLIERVRKTITVDNAKRVTYNIITFTKITAELLSSLHKLDSVYKSAYRGSGLMRTALGPFERIFKLLRSDFDNDPEFNTNAPQMYYNQGLSRERFQNTVQNVMEMNR